MHANTHFKVFVHIKAEVKMRREFRYESHGCIWLISRTPKTNHGILAAVLEKYIFLIPAIRP